MIDRREQSVIEVTEVIQETDKAILVSLDGDECWVPKSIIDDDSEVYSLKSGRDGGIMIVPQWFARKQGWI